MANDMAYETKINVVHEGKVISGLVKEALPGGWKITMTSPYSGLSIFVPKALRERAGTEEPLIFRRKVVLLLQLYTDCGKNKEDVERRKLVREGVCATQAYLPDHPNAVV